MSNARYTIFAARAVFDVDNITATEMRVLAALGTYTNDEGWCYPNQTTLAERLKVTRQTISGAIKKLVAKGYVETEVRTAKGRGKVGYNYRVMLDLKRAEAEPKAEAEQADIGETRRRPTPTTAPADVGEDRDPMSAQPDIPYTEVTNPSERAQPLTLTTFELESPSNKKPKAVKRSRKPVSYTSDFEMIWLAWPKNRRMRSDKRLAFERYQGGVSQFGAEAVAAAAKLYLSEPDTRKDGWKYCCAVEVFMNGRLDAAVEAALEAERETVNGADLHEDDRERAAMSYYAKTGKWPQGYKPKSEAARA